MVARTSRRVMTTLGHGHFHTVEIFEFVLEGVHRRGGWCGLEVGGAT